MSDLELSRRLRDILDRLERVEKPDVGSITGSFTPVLVGSGTAGTFTYTANATLVEWTRSGNRVYFNGRIVITATTVAPTLNMTITGWPYAAVSDSNMAIAGLNDLAFGGITLPANYLQTHLQFANGSSAASIIRSATAGTGLAIVQGAELAAAMDIRFGGSYRVV